MTDSARHVVESVDPAMLKWALRQWSKNSLEMDNQNAVAMALKPAASQAELRAVAHGLRDLAKMPADKLPEALR